MNDLQPDYGPSTQRGVDLAAAPVSGNDRNTFKENDLASLHLPTNPFRPFGGFWPLMGHCFRFRSSQTSIRPRADLRRAGNPHSHPLPHPFALA
jgi:hypothetical protein